MIGKLQAIKRWYHYNIKLNWHRLMMRRWKRKVGTGAYYRYIYHERKAR